MTNEASTNYPEHIVFNKKRFKEEAELAGVEALDVHYPQWVEEKVAAAREANQQEDPDALMFDSSKGIEQLVTFQNIDAFAAHLVAWHQRKLAIVDQIINVPEGSKPEMTMPDGTVKSVELTGDSMTAFQIGISVVMAQFGHLPFTFIEKEQTDAAEQPTGEDPN